MFPCILICIFSVSPYLNETHCNTHSWDVDKEKRSVRIYSSNCWFTKLCKKRPLIWRHHLHTTDQWTAEWERLQSFPDKTPQRKIDNIKSTVFLLKCWHRVCICISFIWDYRLKSSSSLCHCWPSLFFIYFTCCVMNFMIHHSVLLIKADSTTEGANVRTTDRRTAILQHSLRCRK